MRLLHMLFAASAVAALLWVAAPVANAAGSSGAAFVPEAGQFIAAPAIETTATTGPLALGATDALTTTPPASGGGLRGTLTALSSITPTQEITLSVDAVTVVTATAPLTLTIPVTPTSPVTPTAPVVAGPTLDEQYAGVIEGTIVANRTTSEVQFFVEGQTYAVAPLRSVGVQLERPTAALNLFNCDAASTTAQLGCFWDPYLLRKDGFYEVVSGKDAGALVSLILREAGAPPANQIWIQNRTGLREDVYFGTQMRELVPAGVEEFEVESGGVGIFYLRTCVNSGQESVCEWTANSAAPGTYYALVEESWPGGVAGTTMRSLKLLAVLGSSTAATTTVATDGSGVAPLPAAAPITQAAQTICRLAVPALNVRSGPGLEFEIVKKVRSTEIEIASVIVTGRTEDGQWLEVDERVATGGWVIAGVEYLTCDGDTAALPVVAESELPPTPTPLPIVEVVPAAEGAVEGVVESGPITPVVEAPAGPVAPAGYALLSVQNSFDRDMRFTLDQRFRVELGPSEIDLAPGASVSFVVFPGVIGFTASTPWQGISGNAEVILEADQARALYLYFYYDEIDEKWLLAGQ